MFFGKMALTSQSVLEQPFPCNYSGLQVDQIRIIDIYKQTRAGALGPHSKRENIVSTAQVHDDFTSGAASQERFDLGLDRSCPQPVAPIDQGRAALEAGHECFQVLDVAGEVQLLDAPFGD